ncbi:MAG TPA: GTP-binding protein [Chloroflexi bacterium]|nr:GTP-binding protein [Chloroflexota bacterium]
MGRTCKVIVTGAFNAGKSSFIRTISDIPVVSTERRITDELARIKGETTVAMDYGQVNIGGRLFHLFGTPGQERFEFMWDILSKEADALLILVDSTDRSSFPTARRILRRLRSRRRLPYLVVATKQDGRRAMPPEKIAAALGVRPPSFVVSCDARSKQSVHAVLVQLAQLIR